MNRDRQQPPPPAPRRKVYEPLELNEEDEADFAERLPRRNVVPPLPRARGNASTSLGTDAALTALLHPSDDTAVSRAIPAIDLALRALQLARNTTSKGFSELTAARDALAEKYATLQQECLNLKASLATEREMRHAVQMAPLPQQLAHQIEMAVAKERKRLKESFENETAARRTVLEAMCVERARLDRTLQEERAARKTEQETTRIEHAEAERLHRDEHAARQRVLEAICLERSNLEASLDHEQSARKQEQEAFQLERTEAKNLQEGLRAEMAQVAHERDLLASRLDDALRTSTPSAPMPLHGPSATQPIGRIVVKREPKNTAVKKEESLDRNFITPRTLHLPQDNTSPVLQLSAPKALHELPQNPHTGRIVVPREPKDTAVKTEDSANRNFVTPRKRRLPPDSAIQVEGPPSKKFLSTKNSAVSQPPGTRKVEVVITRRSGEIQPGLRNGPPASSGGSSSQPLLGAAKHPPGSAVEEWGTLQFFCPNLTALSTSQMMSGDLLPPSTSWATSQGTRDNTAVAGLLPPAGKALLDAPIFNECLWITHFFDRSTPLDGLLADPALALYVPFITHLHELNESRSSAYRGEVSGAAPPGDAFIDNVAGTRMSEDAWGLVLRFLVLDVLLLYKGHKPAPCVLPDGSGIPHHAVRFTSKLYKWQKNLADAILFNSDGAAPSSSSSSNISEANTHWNATQAHRNLLITALSIMCILQENSSRNPDVQGEPFELHRLSNHHKLPAHTRNSLPATLSRATVNRHLAIFLFVSPLAILLDQDLAEPRVKTKDIFLTAHALGTARPTRIDSAEKYVRDVVLALVEDPALDVPGAFSRTPGAPVYVPPPYNEVFFNLGPEGVKAK